MNAPMCVKFVGLLSRIFISTEMFFFERVSKYDVCELVIGDANYPDVLVNSPTIATNLSKFCGMHRRC